MIPLRGKVTLAVLALALAFASGRYTATSSHTITDTTQDSSTESDKSTHKETDTTVIEHPDGTKETTTRHVIDTNIDKKHTEDATTHMDKTVEANKSPLNVSALAGVDTMNSFKPTYGASFTKQLIGPVTLGAFGMTNGLVGLSVGINF